MALMASRSDCRRIGFVSLAKRKLGDDMEVKSCSILLLAVWPKHSIYAAMLFMIANRAGYMASSFPLPAAMRLYIDCNDWCQPLCAS